MPFRASRSGDFPGQSKVVARFFLKQKKRGVKEENSPDAGSGRREGETERVVCGIGRLWVVVRLSGMRDQRLEDG